MLLSDYQIAGFKAAACLPVALHADMVRRPSASKIIRFGGRVYLGKAAHRRARRRRVLAQFRAMLLSPNIKLFITTSSSTFVFMLGFLS
jgi:hypothetical protein